jgi:hypothetical protein
MSHRLINPTAEDAHWQHSFRAEPYYRTGLGYDGCRATAGELLAA